MIAKLVLPNMRHFTHISCAFLRSGSTKELMEMSVELKDKSGLIGSIKSLLLDFAFCYPLELGVLG